MGETSSRTLIIYLFVKKEQANEITASKENCYSGEPPESSSHIDRKRRSKQLLFLPPALPTANTKSADKRGLGEPPGFLIIWYYKCQGTGLLIIWSIYIFPSLSSQMYSLYNFIDVSIISPLTLESAKATPSSPSSHHPTVGRELGHGVSTPILAF